MHEHKNPFLSAAAIRRILALHPFSEANRAYLIEEAGRREEWEREIEALVREVLTTPTDISPDPVPAREVAGADVTQHHSPLYAGDPSSVG